MTASSTPLATGQRRTEHARLALLVRPVVAILSAVRARWDHLAQAGQLGPVRETEIGRHSGARI